MITLEVAVRRNATTEKLWNKEKDFEPNTQSFLLEASELVMEEKGVTATVRIKGVELKGCDVKYLIHIGKRRQEYDFIIEG